MTLATPVTSFPGAVLVCDATAIFYATLSVCVPNAIAALPAFVAAFQRQRVCPGGNISTISQLEGLRFCTKITTALALSVNDSSADFSALYDIESIQGENLMINPRSFVS